MNKNAVTLQYKPKKLKIMNENPKFNIMERTVAKFDPKKLVDETEERNEKIRAIMKVRDELINAEVNLTEKETNMARTIIEMGTHFAIENA